MEVVPVSCVWEVTAGVIPGQAMPEFTKRWALTSEERHSDDASEIFTNRLWQATEYMQQLQNPNTVNWVRLDWVWF